jgi:hypothetical protein
MSMSSHSSVNQGPSAEGESPIAEAQIPSLLDDV